MAIESDQLVFDFLSRVGDLAQSRQLPSGARMRLVSQLRNEIDKRRAGSTSDSPAAVRRLLAGIGTPEELVRRAAAEAGGQGGTPVSSSAVPEQRTASEGGDTSNPRQLRSKIPRPRLSKPAATPKPQQPPAAETPPPVSPTAASPPHLAGEDELGPSGSEPDWWRVDSSPFGGADSVPGFVGGVEIPEILKPPPGDDDDKRRPKGSTTKEETENEESAEDADEADETDDADAVAVEKAPGRKRRQLLRRAPRLRSTVSGLTNPFLLIAAALLVAGAVTGNLVPLGLGWAIAYTSRRLTQNEAKFAVLGIPGLVLVAGVVWLWGRVEGRWGGPVGEDGQGMQAALTETWPWVLRAAAIASALYLVWRSQRRRPE